MGITAAEVFYQVPVNLCRGGHGRVPCRDPGADDDLLGEVDVDLGYRHETAGGLSYDFGRTRGIYAKDCGGLTDDHEAEAAPSEQEWDPGVTQGRTDEAALHLRYGDGSEYVDSYIGLSLT